MHFSTVVAAVAAVAPVVSAHGGAPIPKIVGLNVKDLKARDLLSSLNARIAEVGRSEVHEKRQPLEARQNTDGQCGEGFGSCAAGVCCSQSGWCGTDADYCYSPGCNYEYGPGCPENITPAGTNTSTVTRTKVGSVEYGGAGIYNCVTPGTVALTYDDGPFKNYTSHILDVFKSYNGKATFFITGNNINKGEIDTTDEFVSVIKRMNTEGHQIASHTWTHLDLSAVSSIDRKNQMWKNEMALRNILGFFPTYMRPPYSSCTAESGCESDMASLGYHVTYFDVDTDDYNQDAPNEIQNSKNWFKGNITAGGATASNSEWLSIGHDIHEQTAYNLTEFMLSTLTTLGYKAVTVGECLGDDSANWYRSSSGSTNPTTTRTTSAPTATGTKTVSTDATCGGTNGYTCQGSTFGNCCSSASTGNLTEAHSLLSWSFDSSLRVKSKRCRVALEVGLVTGAVVLMAASGLIWFIFFRKKALSSKGKEVDEIECDEIIDDEFERAERGPKRYPYEELAGATRNFSKEGKLGEGGFGSVYKGYLKDLKLDVAIKKISRGSKQGRKEYVSEVKIISQLRHRNLVQLVGWCHDRRDFLLVYEFMPNGSLDSYLYTAKKTMEWPVRHKVALGLASALLYLHEEWERCVVHRDIKPSNVMLDSAFNAKLGDFGLARLVDHDSHSQTTVLAGTMGYLAPECVTTGKASKETDVYSFGVVALEIACGRRPMEPAEEKGKVRLVEWVWELYGRATVLEAADAKLQGKFDARQMECLMAVGLWCVHPDCNLRPTIRQAINALNFETPLPELPPKMPVPIYFAPPVELVAASFTHTSSLTDSSMVNSYVTDSSNSILMTADAVKPQKPEATQKCD